LTRTFAATWLLAVVMLVLALALALVDLHVIGVDTAHAAVHHAVQLARSSWTGGQA
jgi:hypothetical protein